MEARAALPTDGSANVMGRWTCLYDKTKHHGRVLNPGRKRRTNGPLLLHIQMNRDYSLPVRQEWRPTSERTSCVA